MSVISLNMPSFSMSVSEDDTDLKKTRSLMM